MRGPFYLTIHFARKMDRYYLCKQNDEQTAFEHPFKQI
jgi:hypothetical protein